MEKMPASPTRRTKHGLPDRTFKDKMTVLSGNDAIDLYYFGPGHTNGDAFVVFRDAARSCTPATSSPSKGTPLLDMNNGGSGVHIGETLTKAAAGIKNVDTVITGHSTVMTWADFVEFGEFNRAFLAAMQAAIKAGKTADQAAGRTEAAREVSASTG